MRTLIVYESMYGNTHQIAEGIASGLRPDAEVRVVSVHEASGDMVSWAELLIVGGPTHIHGMTRPSSRQGASDAAMKPDSGLTLDPDAAGDGLREWFASLGKAVNQRAAAFDTRTDGPALFTGRASGGIAKELRRHGYALVAEPESFLVKENHLVTGEAERAAAWGASLAGDPVAAH